MKGETMRTFKNGKYRRVGELGTGGFGTACLIKDEKDRLFALKIIRGSPEILSLAEKEADLLQKAPHKHVLEYVEHWMEPGVMHIVTEACLQRTLREMLQSAQWTNMSEENILAFAAQIGSGLSHLHGNGIIHRDLKPENIFVAINYLLLADFGLATTEEIAGEHHRTIAGTRPYMSPQMHLREPYTNKADVWSFGCVLYEMLMQRKPFDTDALSLKSLISAMKYRRYAPLDERYSEALRTVVEDMLTLNESERPDIFSVMDVVSRLLRKDPDGEEGQGSTSSTVSFAERLVSQCTCLQGSEREKHLDKLASYAAKSAEAARSLVVDFNVMSTLADVLIDSPEEISRFAVLDCILEILEKSEGGGVVAAKVQESGLPSLLRRLCSRRSTSPAVADACRAVLDALHGPTNKTGDNLQGVASGVPSQQFAFSQRDPIDSVSLMGGHPLLAAPGTLPPHHPSNLNSLRPCSELPSQQLVVSQFEPAASALLPASPVPIAPQCNSRSGEHARHPHPNEAYLSALPAKQEPADASRTDDCLLSASAIEVSQCHINSQLESEHLGSSAGVQGLSLQPGMSNESDESLNSSAATTKGLDDHTLGGKSTGAESQDHIPVAGDSLENTMREPAGAGNESKESFDLGSEKSASTELSAMDISDSGSGESTCESEGESKVVLAEAATRSSGMDSPVQQAPYSCSPQASEDSLSDHASPDTYFIPPSPAKVESYESQAETASDSASDSRSTTPTSVSPKCDVENHPKQCKECRKADPLREPQAASERLVQAAGEGLLACVSYLVHRGVDPACPARDDGYTPAQSAAAKGQLHTLKYLLSGLVDPHTPHLLHLALCSKNKQTAYYLLHEAGVDPHQQNEAECETPIHWSARGGHLDLLLYFSGKGFDPKALNKSRSSILNIAAYHGHLEVLKYGVERLKLSVAARNAYGNSPIDDAKRGFKFDCEKYLKRQKTKKAMVGVLKKPLALLKS
eukprot:Rmarinus@m.27520